MHLSPLDWVMDLGKTTEVDKFSPCRVKDTYFRNTLLLSVLSFLSRPREFCRTWLSIDTIRMEYCSLLSPHACMCVWMYWSVCPFVRSVQQWLIYISMDSWVCFYTLGYNLAPFIFLLRFFPFGHGSPFSLLLTLFTYPYHFFLRVHFPTFGHGSKFIVYSAVFWQFVCSCTWKMFHFILSYTASDERCPLIQTGELCKWCSISLWVTSRLCLCFVSWRFIVMWLDMCFSVIKP